MLNALLRLIFPATCTVCKIGLSEKEEMICTSCSYDLPVFKDQKMLLNRFLGKIDINEALGYLTYEKQNATQKILHDIKYRGNQHLGVLMGEKMSLECFERLETSYDCIIPIPLHPKRKLKRAFNQSEALAKGLVKHIPVPIDTQSLVRRINTTTQTRKTRIERWGNIESAFIVQNADLIVNKNILLVDDVVTTGSTTAHAISVLKKAGALSVGVVFLGVSQ